MKSKACLLVPETENEVVLELEQTKFIDSLEQYCHCSKDGYQLGCSHDKNVFKDCILNNLSLSPVRVRTSLSPITLP